MEISLPHNVLLQSCDVSCTQEHMYKGPENFRFETHDFKRCCPQKEVCAGLCAGMRQMLGFSSSLFDWQFLSRI